MQDSGREASRGLTCALQAMLGGGASVVLEGQRVLPARSQDAGFRFRYSHIGPAIASICG
jgi:NAD dependent epimerase/dehydratase family enzyme